MRHVLACYTKTTTGITLCIVDESLTFLAPADFLQNQRFRYILSGIIIPSACKIVWIQIRSDEIKSYM